jgi:acyl carrier protein phosphodiesterase
MNFLAHLYLAGPPTAPDYLGQLVGQFIADSVPGRQPERYPAAVQAGIRAHRAIDTFTDQHPVVRRSTARLRAAGAGKYAGVVADIFYDHFLARHFQELAGEGLAGFTQRVYAALATQQAGFPAAVQGFFPHLVQHDWLLHYAEIAGVGRALLGLSRRASPGSGMDLATTELVHHYTDYEADFQEFWPQLVADVAARRAAAQLDERG